MNIYGLGILITGASGIGKSELALALIDRGHQLIADDAPQFYAQSSGAVIGKSPQTLSYLLSLRGLGIINMKHLRGDSSVCEQQVLSLIIHLVSENPRQQPGEPIYHEKALLNSTIAYITLPFQNHRRNELLIETIVRHFQLKQAAAQPSITL